jgi:hypothetical protein
MANARNGALRVARDLTNEHYQIDPTISRRPLHCYNACFRVDARDPFQIHFFDKNLATDDEL